ETARQPLQLAMAQRCGIDRDTTLGAAERKIRKGALPGHPHRQRLDFVEVGLGVVTQAALGGSARHVVLDAITLVDPKAAVGRNVYSGACPTRSTPPHSRPTTRCATERCSLTCASPGSTSSSASLVRCSSRWGSSPIASPRFPRARTSTSTAGSAAAAGEPLSSSAPTAGPG